MKLPAKNKTGAMGPRLGKSRREFLRDWRLHLLILLPIMYLLIFSYWPMYGVQIAFRDYRPRAGITGSEWVGFKWFRRFLGSYNFNRIFWNTVVISLYQLVVGFPIPVILALMLNSMRSQKLKRVVQSVAYMPHFISIVVVVSIMNLVFSPINGIYGNLFRALGGIGYPHDFRGTAESFLHMYVWSGEWQNAGWSTIIYTAALAAVPLDLHEAATLDGASRWQRILHVDLPTIMPTVATMLILRFGSVLGVGYEKVFLMQTDLNLSVSEVISTYTYKTGLGGSGNLSYGAAIGLFNSVINCVMLILVNHITKKMSDNQVSLF